jgi:N-acetylglucosaminyldiphosphoundecaprenol N-acetyl-beta-D-mannosaminyltransferase
MLTMAGPATTPGDVRIRMLGCSIDVLTLGETVQRIERAISARVTTQHVAINAAKLVKYQTDGILRGAIDGCELATADGQAVVWASHVLGRPLPERVAGIDLMHALLAAAQVRGHRIYLLGARAEIVDRAAAAIESAYPGVSIVGRHHGYFSAESEPDVVAQVAGARPDILFVALETPAKELFLARNRERLGIPFVMGVGGAFDVLAGMRRRAPRWMRRAGLEWLYRLAQDPRRLARRYVVGNTQFIWLVLKELLRGARRLNRYGSAAGV